MGIGGTGIEIDIDQPLPTLTDTMLKQNDFFGFTPLTETEWAAMRLTDDDLARLLRPCKLMPYVATVGAPDQHTIDTTTKPTQRQAKQARRL